MIYPTLPPDLAQLAHIVDAEPPDVQELVPYTLTLLLIGDDKAEVVECQKIDGREWLTVLTAAGEEFSVVKPNVIDLRQLQELISRVRHVLDEDRTTGHQD